MITSTYKSMFTGLIILIIIALNGSAPASVQMESTTPSDVFTQATATERVSFSNGDVTLSGSLYLPDGAGPFPAVVILHGAGAETRQGYTRDAQTFASNGIAALVYDKRGTGGSSGDWQSASLFDLIDDTLAGVSYLQTQPAIEADQVGLIGFSQGAWLLPFAASRSDHVAFIIPVTGSATSLAAQEMWGVGNALAARGFSPRAIRTTMNAMHLLYSMRPFIQRGWLPLDDLWFNAYDPYLDPTLAWSDMTQPALVVFAGGDSSVPTADSVDILTPLIQNGHPASQIVVYPNAAHSMGGPTERNTNTAYITKLINWTQAVTSDQVPNPVSSSAQTDTQLQWYGSGDQPTRWYATALAQTIFLLVFIITIPVGVALMILAFRRRDMLQGIMDGAAILLIGALLAGWGSTLTYLLYADAEGSAPTVPFSGLIAVGSGLFLIVLVSQAVRLFTRRDESYRSKTRISFVVALGGFVWFLAYWGLVGLPV